MRSPRLLLHFHFRVWSVSSCSSGLPKPDFSFMSLSEENLNPLQVFGNALTSSKTKLTPWSRLLLERAQRSSACQEILRILWHSGVLGCIHNSQPPAPVLSQINPVPAPHPTSWSSILSYLPIHAETITILTDSNESTSSTQIFTDGSKSEQGVGAGIAIFRLGKHFKNINTD